MLTDSCCIRSPLVQYGHFLRTFVFCDEIADFIKNNQVSGVSEISFVIGGSNGLSKQLLDKATLKLSFGKITFPHQLFRVVLCEQIYRAFTILNNLPYHK